MAYRSQIMPKTTVHLIRHGQSEFNAAFDSIVRRDPMIFDPNLTELGRAQASALASDARWPGIELIVVSPLTRAIQTAQHVFKGHQAPWHVEPMHREKCEHSGDVGRAPRLLAADFPHLAFHHLDDPWWHHDPQRPDAIAVEPEPFLQARVSAFGRWLAGRAETKIAVVGHGTFLNRLTGIAFKNCDVVTREF
jgi:broad specificity phosphatase PhoE